MGLGRRSRIPSIRRTILASPEVESKERKQRMDEAAAFPAVAPVEAGSQVVVAYT